MDGAITIKQCFTRQYTNKNGEVVTEIMGLGDDNQVYQWHRGTGKWILAVINS